MYNGVQVGMFGHLNFIRPTSTLNCWFPYGLSQDDPNNYIIMDLDLDSAKRISFSSNH